MYSAMSVRAWRIPALYKYPYYYYYYFYYTRAEKVKITDILKYIANAVRCVILENKAICNQSFKFINGL